MILKFKKFNAKDVDILLHICYSLINKYKYIFLESLITKVIE